MVPKHVYEKFDAEEQKLWHSHEFEVLSGMLVLPKPKGADPDEWEAGELKAMKEVVGLYGKTWHFWQVDRGDQYPLGTYKRLDPSGNQAGRWFSDTDNPRLQVCLS